MTSPPSSHRLKAAFVVLAVVVGASVLWVRQTPDALLRVNSYSAALAEVAFWAAPTVLLYVLIARRRSAVVAGGAALVVSVPLGWWWFATDRHSTASLGPAMVGWLFGPFVMFSGWFGDRLVRDARREHR